MKNLKRVIMTAAIVLMVGAASVTAFAASSYSTPAEAAAGLTGRTAEEVAEARAEMLQIKKEILADRVEAGLMTQERADEIIAAIEANQSVCDGTGSLRTGQKMGAGFGGMNGYGQGYGQGMRGLGQCGGLGQAQ